MAIQARFRSTRCATRRDSSHPNTHASRVRSTRCAAAVWWDSSPLATDIQRRPSERHGPLLLDMATSVAAIGRIMEAGKAGRSIPEGWALTVDGTPTTDPAEAATALPLGGPKGSGLSLMIECLSSLMAGAPILAPRLGRTGEGRHLQNATVVLMDIAAFRPLDEYQRDVDELADRLKALPPAEGVDAILLPGERGARTEALRDAGIPHAELVEQFNLMFMVNRAEIDYVRPAILDDTLVVETETSDVGGATVLLRQTVSSPRGVCAIVRIKLACVRIGGNKPARIPPRWRQVLAAMRRDLGTDTQRED